MPEIDAYKVALLRLTPNAKNCHNIYMREHFIRLIDPNKPKGRTLFLLNVPPYVTENSLKKFYSQIGDVISVAFAEKPGRNETEKWQQHVTPFSANSEYPFKFKVAYIVFKSTKSINRALTLNSIDLFSITSGESTVETGMQLWHSQYEKRFLNEDDALAEIDKFMADYDERERIAQEAAKNATADADGWITVGKQGKNAGFEQKETIINTLEEKIAKSKKKELTNFYTFQIRESKMKSIIDLRKKFEEDKRKIELLKQSRRFKPF